MSLAKNQRKFLFERAFKMMKNSIYLIVIALLVADSDSTGLKFGGVDVLQELQILIVVMMSP